MSLDDDWRAAVFGPASEEETERYNSMRLVLSPFEMFRTLEFTLRRKNEEIAFLRNELRKSGYRFASPADIPGGDDGD